MVAVPTGGGSATTDKHGVGSHTEDKVGTTSSSVPSASADSDSSDGTPVSSKPTTDPQEKELVQSVAKFIQAQTDMMAAQTIE